MNTVLIVEDSLTEQVILAKYLQQAGFQVLTASSATEAMVTVSRHQLDVIILDVVLPDRSGFEICRELKAQAHTSSIPIIICSTKGGKMDKFWGLTQGADAYLSKPVDQEEFIDAVKHLLKA
ncbi:response regulator [Lyngbya aestuarii]|uniref:response regulator n=1 Tax=Lyngbya aestuarii TaxID=118322 RepID=UPI00403E1216